MFLETNKKMCTKFLICQTWPTVTSWGCTKFICFNIFHFRIEGERDGLGMVQGWPLDYLWTWTVVSPMPHPRPALPTSERLSSSQGEDALGPKSLNTFDWFLSLLTVTRKKIIWLKKKRVQFCTWLSLFTSIYFIV